MKRKILTLTLILGLMLFAGKAWPDFGSFSGNSDYGSSRSSSESSRSSSGSSRSSSSSTRSYSSGGGYTRRSSSGTNVNVIPLAGGISGITAGGGSDEFTDDDAATCIGVGFVFLIFFLYWYMTHRKAKKNQRTELIINEPVRILRPMDEYLELDSEFDEERIKTMISNLYVQMQETWQAKDISSLRPYFTDKFYAQMDRQLEQFRKGGRTDYTERIAVLSTDLRGWRQSAGMDYVTVGLNARIVSYVLDDRTGQLISGDKSREKFMEYELELCRKSGMTTRAESEGVRAERCPHCGAPLNVNASARCEYCGSVITSVNTDWAVCAMRGISQRTA